MDPTERALSALQRPQGPGATRPDGPLASRLPGASRAVWLKHLHRWHWISSALCLVGMLLFAVTGITLNHAADIEASPRVAEATAALPEELRQDLGRLATQTPRGAPLPASVRAWLSTTLGLSVADRPAEWSEDEIYLALPRPGGDAWLAVDLESGEVLHEVTDRGWIAYLNDLHKGRNTGPAWGWFIDAFAIACLVFCITGLVLLQLHARGRPSTWPLVGLGLVAPLLLALLFIHA